MHRNLIPGVVLALAVSGCAAGTGQPTDPQDVTAQPTEQASPSEHTPDATKSPGTGDGNEQVNLDAGPVPDDIVDEVVADVLERAEADASEIEVVEAHTETWNDGSLGCPEPGRMYTQALVDGYRLVLRVGDEEFDYHVADSGHFVLCEDGQPADSATQ